MKHSRFIELTLKISLIFCLIISALLPPFVVILKIDPLHPLLKYLLADDANSMLIKLIRLLLYYFDIIENVYLMIGSIMVAIVLIFTTYRLLVLICNQYFKTFKTGFNLTSNIKYRRKYFYYSIYIINCLRIIWTNEMQNGLKVFLLPVSLFLTVALAVVFNCGTIKLVNTMIMLFYLLMPIGSVICGFTIIFVIGYACEIHEKSWVALENLETLVVTKYEKKYLKSTSGFGIPLGRFLVLQKKNRLAFFDANPNYTMTLLVML